jgi:hypothetical protein
MRRDFQIAILIGLAAVPCGAALMVAPEYLHLLHKAQAITFWGGLGLTVLLIAAAIALALRAEVEAPKTGHRSRMAAIIGMAIFGLGFVVCTIWFFVEQPDNQPVAEAAEKPATMQANSASPYADHDKGQWNGNKFIFDEPKHVFTVEVTAADNGRQIPFKVNLPPMASVDLSIKIDPLIFDNRNVQARFGYKDIRIPWDGTSRHSMLAFVPNDQTFYLETLKAIPSNSSIIKVYMNAWWPPKN